MSYGQRTDRHVKGNKEQPLADWNELAADLIYTLGKEFGWAKGMRMRARWARVWENGGQFSGGTITDISQQHSDVRFDLQWRVVFNWMRNVDSVLEDPLLLNIWQPDGRTAVREDARARRSMLWSVCWYLSTFAIGATRCSSARFAPPSCITSSRGLVLRRCRMPRRWASLASRWVRRSSSRSISRLRERVKRVAIPNLRTKSADRMALQAGMSRWVGLGVIADNLINIANAMVPPTQGR